MAKGKSIDSKPREKFCTVFGVMLLPFPITHASFELDAALEGLSVEDVLRAIDYPKYFALLKAPMPQTHAEIARCLTEDGIVARREDGLYTITNLGAILLANDLAKFPTVSRKAMRVIQYEGTRRRVCYASGHLQKAMLSTTRRQ